MGSGNLGGQSQITLSAVIEPKVNLSITSLQHKSNYATVKGVFSNSDISEGFYWRELGVYAQDPDLGEILYCYGNAGALAEYIPSQTSEIIEKVVSVSLIVGNVTSVSATIDESLVYVSKEDLVAVESDLRAKVAGGNGTAITVNMDSATAYIAGMVVRIIATADNNSEATTLKINDLIAKPVYKVNTQAAPKIVTGKPYTFILSADLSHFFLEASASGTASAEHVLAPYTVSTDEGTDIVGTMQNNGPDIAETINLTTEGAEYLIPKGYQSGLRKIKAVITGLIASVIKAGATVGGILGTFTADATATASKILTGDSAYVNGIKINGSMNNYNGVVMPNDLKAYSMTRAPIRRESTPVTDWYFKLNASGKIDQQTECSIGLTNLVPENIKSGITIGDGVGTLLGTASSGKKFATGNVTSSANTVQFKYYDNSGNPSLCSVTVSGLTFLPSLIVLRWQGGNTNYVSIYTGDNQRCNVGVFGGNTGNSIDYAIAANGSVVAYVNATGFCLPVQGANTIFTWWAYE
jgi:hypothetical protein